MELVQRCLWIIFIGLMLSTYKSYAARTSTGREPEFNAILVFGDSVVDAGNNNYLETLCKSNHPPYGIRFPGKIPTGRFSDGKLVTDFLASMLRIKETVPPYLQPNLSNHELITGVSFASGCAGLDDRTFAITGRIPMSKQIEYFKDYVSRLTTIVGSKKAKKIINEALVVIHVGGNDFLYHLNIIPFNRTEPNSGDDLDNYRDFLLNKLQTFLKEVYDLGCRRMVLVGIPPLGCLPLTITLMNSPIIPRTCVENKNLEAQSYNQKLVELLPQIQANLSGSKLWFSDTIGPVIDMINHPQKHGLMQTGKGCCGTGLFEFGPFCNTVIPSCSNSFQYLFWDSVHPSEITYHYFARQIFNMLQAK